MKKHKKIIAAAAAVLAAAIFLSGCGLFGLFKPTVISLSGKALKKMQDVQSASTAAEIDSAVTIRQPTFGVEVQAELDAGLNMDMTRNPQRIRGDGQVEISVLGQEQKIGGSYYVDSDKNGGITTYLKLDGLDWVKKTGKTDSAKESAAADDPNSSTDDAAKASEPSTDDAAKASEPSTDDAAKASDPSTDGAANASDPSKEGAAASEDSNSSTDGSGAADRSAIKPLLFAAGMLKSMSDGSLEAVLQEETVTVNDQEAWQIDCTISGPLMKEILQQQKLFTEDGDVNIDKVDWDQVVIPAQIYLYKESGLPARIQADCTSIGTQLLGQAIADSLGDLPIGKFEVEFSELLIDMTIDRYNETEAIEIPLEALNGVETDTILPSLGDFLQF